MISSHGNRSRGRTTGQKAYDGSKKYYKIRAPKYVNARERAKRAVLYHPVSLANQIKPGITHETRPKKRVKYEDEREKINTKHRQICAGRVPREQGCDGS